MPTANKYMPSIFGVLVCTLFLFNAPAVAATPEEAPVPVPVVIWHGMGDSCCNPLSMGYIRKLLKTSIPGVYVNSLMLGENVLSDSEHGFFANMNAQVEEACEKIRNDSQLANGYNAIGFSQGGLFVRALAQRCPHPPMHTLVSVGGPQQGIYGLPHCPGDTTLCNAVRHLIDYGAYARVVQRFVVQAQYWHDPFVSEGYANRSMFLADLNCERGAEHCNTSYKQNLLKLDNILLVQFTRDEMVVPKESEWFGYYPPNNIDSIVPMEQSTLYTQDLIGLKQLKESGRLHFLSVEGQHLQISASVFIHEIVDKYLKNSTHSHSGKHRQGRGGAKHLHLKKDWSDVEASD